MGRAHRNDRAVAGARRPEVLAPEGVRWFSASPAIDCESPLDLDPPRERPPACLRYPRGSVLLVGGLYGLGKSTLAQRLCADATIIDPDAVRADLAVDWTENDGYREVFAELFDRVESALQGGETVVCTLPGLRSWQRRRLSRQAKAHGVDFNIIYLDGDVATAAEGQTERGRVIPEEWMETMAGEWNYLRWRLAHAAGVDGGPGDEYGLKMLTKNARSVLVLDREAADSVQALRFGD